MPAATACSMLPCRSYAKARFAHPSTSVGSKVVAVGQLFDGFQMLTSIGERASMGDVVDALDAPVNPDSFVPRDSGQELEASTVLEALQYRLIQLINGFERPQERSFIGGRVQSDVVPDVPRHQAVPSGIRVSVIIGNCVVVARELVVRCEPLGGGV